MKNIQYFDGVNKILPVSFKTNATIFSMTRAKPYIKTLSKINNMSKSRAKNGLIKTVTHWLYLGLGSFSEVIVFYCQIIDFHCHEIVFTVRN